MTGRILELGGCPDVDECLTAGAFSFVCTASFLPMLIIARPFLVPFVLVIARLVSPLQYSIFSSSNQTSSTQPAAISRTRFVLVRLCCVVLADTHTLHVMPLVPPSFLQQLVAPTSASLQPSRWATAPVVTPYFVAATMNTRTSSTAF